MIGRKTPPFLTDTLTELMFPNVKLTLTVKRKLVLLSVIIASAQLLLRLGCIGEYGFHQDELLYLALSDHLSWGYREVPPFIAFIGAISKSVFGESVAAVRILPSLCAYAIVIFTGLMTIKLGGKSFAVCVACCTVAFSPAFLAAGALFIPQVFDELCWTIIAYLLVVFIQTKNEKLLLWLGLIAGLAMLVKYTFVLFLMGLLLGFLLNKEQRTFFKLKTFWYAVGIAFAIFIPHLWWQYQNGFPALNHYSELRQTQLVYLSRADFIIQQFLVNGTGLVVWLGGVALLFTAKYKEYRLFGVAFLIVMGALLVLNGKPYYGFGCFPPLFALGAILCERLFRKANAILKSVFFAFLILPSLILSIIVLPYLPIEKTAKVFEWTYINLGIHYPLKWEDQRIHNMNQNYADMIGWEELASKTSKLYLSLPVDERNQTVVLAEKYGEAGAIDQYQKSYVLPTVISFSSSFALWAPQQLQAKHVIYISSTPPPAFITAKKMGEIENPYSRVVGMQIYLIANVDRPTKGWYQQKWTAARIMR